MLSKEQYINEVTEAIEYRMPYSHVRLGDGEAIVMGYPDFYSAEYTKKRWDMFTGAGVVPQKDYNILASKIMGAVTSSNIVGFPVINYFPKHRDKNWVNLVKICEKYNLIDRVVPLDYTWDICRCGDIGQIIRQAERVVCITWHENIREKIINVFGVDKVKHIPIPPQFRPHYRDIKEPHYPDWFNRVRQVIKFNTEPGDLYLIGAGAFGKIYCGDAKRAGAVALDIGSVFDGWMGYTSRFFLRGFPKL